MSGDGGRPRYRAFGGLSALVDGRAVDLGRPKQQAVLAVLLLEVGQVVSLERLAEVVWGDAVPGQADVSLRAYVSHLRQALEPGRTTRDAPTTIVTRRPGYVLQADRDDIDIASFEDQVADGQALLRRGDPTGAATVFDRALQLWTGAPFVGIDADLSAHPVIVRLEARRSEASEALFEARLALGEHAALVPTLTEAVAAEPLREARRAQLALALYRSGRQVDALRSLADARAVLADEVGVDPGPELRELEAAILRHDESLAWTAAPTAPTPGSAPAPVATSAGGVPPPPSARRWVPRTAGPLVGRAEPLAVALEAAAAAVGGAGRALIVSGEAGIGKTRLVEELAASVTDDGTFVAWSRCPESAASAAFWPWSQIAEQLAVGTDGASSLTDALASRSAAGAPGAAPQGAADAMEVAGEQLALRAAAVRALADAGRPLVLVIDDLQWADPASLRLVEHLAGELASMPVLLVATLRPVAGAPDAPGELLDALDELARRGHAVRIDLDGLAEGAVASWIDQRAGRPVGPAVATFVHERSGGNPFFVRELVDLLDSEGRLDAHGVIGGLAVPAAVQEVVRRRFGRLPPDTQQVLAVASVVGRRFGLEVLARVADRSVDETLDALDPALDAGLVDVDEGVGRFSFSHALVAETLASEPSAIRRSRLHASTARAIAALHGPALDPVIAELAHHAFAGASTGTAAEAVTYSVRAAELATEATSHVDAAAHLARAVQAHDLAAPADLDGRYQLLHQLGLACQRGDDVPGAYSAMCEAATVADAIGRPDLMAESLRHLHAETLWSNVEWQSTDPRVSNLMERALATMPPGDRAARAELLANLAVERMTTSGDDHRGDALSAEAVAMARRLGDPVVLARTLVLRYFATWRPAAQPDRVLIAEEYQQLVAANDLSPRLVALAAQLRWCAAYEVGDPVASAAAMRDASATADRVRTPVLFATLACSRASEHLLAGRFVEAEAAAAEMFEALNGGRRLNAVMLEVAIRAQAWMEQGRLAEVLPEFETAFDSTSYAGPFAWFTAWLLAEDGQIELADVVLHSFDEHLADDWVRPPMATAALHVAADLGDREFAARRFDELLGASGQIAYGGSGGITIGPVDLALARGARLLGDDDASARYLDAALAFADRMSSGPARARCLAFRYEVHREAADLAEARAITERLGMVALGRRLDRLDGLEGLEGLDIVGA